MSVNNKFEILWKQVNTSTFMYGTKLSFTSEGTSFKNELMPSGILIHEWQMITHYPTDKEGPMLPILQRGEVYNFIFDFDVIPKGSVYFKIIFYHKNGTKIDKKIIRDKECKVMFPQNAFSYKVQMINAASESLIFRKIIIEDRQEEKRKKENTYLSNMYNNSQSKIVNVIFVEPFLQDYVLSSFATQNIQNVVEVRKWYDSSMISNIYRIEEEIRNLAYDEIHCIGYGPKSNEVAEIIGLIFGGKVFTTFHQSRNVFDQLESFRTVNTRNKYIKPFIYVNHPDDIERHPVSPLVNFARYLQYLDVKLLNSGGANE